MMAVKSTLIIRRQNNRMYPIKCVPIVEYYEPNIPICCLTDQLSGNIWLDLKKIEL